MIKKTKRGYEVLSEKSKRSMGIYSDKASALARLKQIEDFKKKFLKNKKGGK